MPPYQGKTRQLLGGAGLHGPARGMEQPAAVNQIQLGNIQLATIALAVPNAQIHPSNLDIGVRQPVPGKLQPLAQLVAHRLRHFSTAHRHIAARALFKRQFQSVGFEILKHNPHSHQRGKGVKPDIEVLQICHNIAGLRMANPDITGGKGRVKPVPAGRQAADADLMAQTVGKLAGQIIAKAVNILGQLAPQPGIEGEKHQHQKKSPPDQAGKASRQTNRGALWQIFRKRRLLVGGGHPGTLRHWPDVCPGIRAIQHRTAPDCRTALPGSEWFC